MSRLMPLLTAILAVGAFAAFFVSFLFAPFAILALLYGAMFFAGRARAAKKRQRQAPPAVTHHDKHTTV